MSMKEKIPKKTSLISLYKPLTPRTVCRDTNVLLPKLICTHYLDDRLSVILSKLMDFQLFFFRLIFDDDSSVVKDLDWLKLQEGVYNDMEHQMISFWILWKNYCLYMKNFLLYFIHKYILSIYSVNTFVNLSMLVFSREHINSISWLTHNSQWLSDVVSESSRVGAGVFAANLRSVVRYCGFKIDHIKAERNCFRHSLPCYFTFDKMCLHTLLILINRSWLWWSIRSYLLHTWCKDYV